MLLQQAVRTSWINLILLPTVLVCTVLSIARRKKHIGGWLFYFLLLDFRFCPSLRERGLAEPKGLRSIVPAPSYKSRGSRGGSISSFHWHLRRSGHRSHCTREKRVGLARTFTARVASRSDHRGPFRRVGHSLLSGGCEVQCGALDWAVLMVALFLFLETRAACLARRIRK